MTYLILSETDGFPFTSHIDNIEAKTSLDGCEGVEPDSIVFPKNLLITIEKILNFEPRNVHCLVIRTARIVEF